MEEFRGYVSHIIYRNDDNAYTVFEFVSGGEQITCTGFVPSVSVGESCHITGTFVSHPVYGEQLKLSRYEAAPPEDTEAVYRYLSSGAVKGIGEGLAKRIIRTFGDDTLNVMEQQPERLSEVRGISERMAREIAAQMEGKRDERSAMIFLQKYGISGRYAIKIWKTYGMGLYSIFRENPYRLAEDISGIGFATADRIASRLGIRADSDFRIRSGILYVLSLALQEGNSWIPESILIRRTAALLKVEEDPVRLQLGNLAIDGQIRIRRKPHPEMEGEEVQVYLSGVYREEQRIASMLLDINTAQPHIEDADEIETDVRRLEKEEDIVLDDLQRKAVLLSAQKPILILSGGPGTGKTTTINTIIRLLLSKNMRIVLAAPTGRAAKRMTEASGYEAMTIHRLLGVRSVREDGYDAEGEAGSYSWFEKDQDDPLEADAIIIDEMSMVDMHLFHSLLKAVTPGTRLIFVGDVNQLPSVGPGKILRDLIDSKAFCTIILHRIFRQAQESDIVMNAHRVLQGEEIRTDNHSRDFFFLERDRIPVIYKHMVLLIRQMLPGYVGCDPSEIQVLTPMRKGSLGVIKLNEVLQSVLNPPDRRKKECMRQDIVFREGDKVMQIRNNYQLEWEVRGNFGMPVDRGTGIFNGDFGKITQIDTAAETLEVCFDGERVVTYSFSELDDLDLAYAITVHKSQGSEYPAVIMPLLGGPSGLFNRNLLYTAITRARKCVVILGSRKAVHDMESNISPYIRYTGLKDRLNELSPVRGLVQEECGSTEEYELSENEEDNRADEGSLFSETMPGM